MQQLRFIISGGGTGGHIFPAIAIANALKKRLPNAEILFVGAKDKMEMEKVPAAGYKIEGLWISGLQRKLTFANFLFPFKLISSMFRAKKIIKEFKPDVVIGVGGFASGPTLKMAVSAGVPALIQEQNSYPGITNIMLSKKVNRICVAYDGMEKYFPKDKIVMTGNPVRQDIISLEGKKERGLGFFGLNPDKKILLIIGGSLGARSINESIQDGLREFRKKGIQVIWQTGKTYYSIAEEAVKEFAPDNIKAYDFVTKMDYAYAVADLVVSRAGASSVSELCLVKKPAILVPYPFAAEDHQTKNAMALVNHGAALLVKDADTKKELVNKAIELINDDDARAKLSANIDKLAMRDSADVIANEVINLVKKK